MHRRIVLFVALMAAFALAAPAGASAKSPADLAPSVALVQLHRRLRESRRLLCRPAGPSELRPGLPKRPVRPLRHAAVGPARAVSQHGQRPLRRGAAFRTFCSTAEPAATSLRIA